MTVYTHEFFKGESDCSRTSAQVVVPLLIELLKPTSVLDVGCGVGEWLAGFRKYGVDVIGVDGDYVDFSLLAIPRECFQAADLTKSLKLDRKFDLVLSLEVAEHISEEYADLFVKTLINHGSVILFSAAIPFQGGTHHVNEQWQSYWAKKFAAEGYVCVAYMRRLIWNNTDVHWTYAQNMLLYIKKDEIARPQFSALQPWVREMPMDIAHPKPYLSMAHLEQHNGTSLLKLAVQRFLSRLGLGR